MLVTRTRRWTCLPESLTHIVSDDNVLVQASQCRDAGSARAHVQQAGYPLERLDVMFDVRQQCASGHEGGCCTAGSGDGSLAVSCG